jgi:FlaA1/EpsC-like NDP-sugar epimerase
MTLDASLFPWEDFLGRSLHDPMQSISNVHRDKTVLITGAGGSVGSALVKSLAAYGSRALILLDSSENNLFRIESQLDKANCSAVHLPILGSVCDENLLCDVFERYRPEIVYHAAAYKHVPLMEANPFAVMRNNALGTYILARMTLRCGACDLMLISTDKAVNPRSLLGASKRIAELVVLALGDSGTCMKAIRLGNVLGSEGSVVAIFLQQIANGEPVTVAHREARRYFSPWRKQFAISAQPPRSTAKSKYSCRKSARR